MRIRMGLMALVLAACAAATPALAHGPGERHWHHGHWDHWRHSHWDHGRNWGWYRGAWGYWSGPTWYPSLSISIGTPAPAYVVPVPTQTYVPAPAYQPPVAYYPRPPRCSQVIDNRGYMVRDPYGAPYVTCDR
jgi:hypothetical protein